MATFKKYKKEITKENVPSICYAGILKKKNDEWVSISGKIAKVIQMSQVNNKLVVTDLKDGKKYEFDDFKLANDTHEIQVLTKKDCRTFSNGYHIIHLFNSYDGHNSSYIFEVKRLGLLKDTPKHKRFCWYRIYEDDSYEGIGSVNKLSFVSCSLTEDGKQVRVLQEDGKNVLVMFDDLCVVIDNKKGRVNDNIGLFEGKFIKAISDRNKLF